MKMTRLFFLFASLAAGAATTAWAQTTHTWNSATPGSWNNAGSWTSNALPTSFTGLDTVSLSQDWTTAPTWTLDTGSTILLNKLDYNDTGASGDVGGTITAGTAGSTITLAGTTPTITVTPALTNGLTINADLLGTSGLTKAGQGSIVLGGDNSGLSGTLTINDPGATNNGGIYFSNAAALGGLTNVIVQGTPTTGGFFRLAGTGITVPSTVSFALSGQGGNSAPNGSLVGSGTGVNAIQGSVTLNTNGIRISNAGATRLDLTGAITQNYTSGATDGLLFRVADNEGIHLTNTSNSWTVQTINSQGILWAEPGALPAASNLLLAGSGDGLLQTSGTLTRAVGNAAGQVQWAVTNSGRAGGFSARGGDLAINLGGAGADLQFNNFTAASGGTSTSVNMNTLWLQGPHADSKLTLANAVDINGAGRTIRTDANVAELTGGLKNSSATAATLTKTGNGTLLSTAGITGALALTTSGGTLEVSGSGANTYTGAVNVNGGSLLVKRSDGLGTTAAGTTVGGGTNQGSLKFDASGGDISTAENITLGMRASLVTNNATAMVPNITNLAGNTTLSGLINGVTGGAVTKVASDGGLLTLSGELRQSGASPAASSRMTNLQGSGNALISGTVTQAAGITHIVDKFGTGTWTLANAANTYTGATRLVEGTVAVTKVADGGTVSSLGAATNAAGNLVFNGGTLRYTGSGDSTDRLFTLNPGGGTLDASGTGALKFTNTGAAVSSDGTAANAVQFTFASGSTTVAFNDSTSIVVGSVISGTPGLPANATVTAINHSTGLLTINQPTTSASGGATGNGQATTVAMARSLTLTGTSTAANELAAALSDSATAPLAVVKNGPGTWHLTGTSTYTGGTTVTAGVLNLANLASVKGDVSVTNASATFSGAGSVEGDISVTGGTLRLGDGVVRGTLSTGGGVSLASGTTLRLTIDSAASMDKLANSGLFNASNTELDVDFNATPGSYAVATDAIDIASATRFTFVTGPVDSAFTFSNATTMSAQDAAALGLSGPQAEVTFDGQRFLVEKGSLSLVAIAPVPEPGTLALAAAALVGLLRRRRAE